jgi:hypothetical protein
MRRVSVPALIACCIAGLALPLSAQDLDDMLSKYTSENGQGYMQPLGDAFGACVNTGLFHGENLREEGLHLGLSLEFMMAPVSDESKVFTASTEEPFYPDTSVQAPTVFGDSQGPSVEGTGGTVFNFPGGFEIDKVPFLVPQLNIGTFRGTQAAIRFISFNVDDNIGDVQVFGFGVRHSISQWIKREFPLDVSAAFFMQSYDVGDIVDANATYFGLIGGYTRGVLTLYGGPGIESSSLDITYDIETDTDSTTVEFNLDGANSARFTLGAAVDLRILQLHVDYNFASQSTVGFGIGFGM